MLRRVGLIYLRLGQLDKAPASYAKANRRLDQYYDEFPSKDLRLEQTRVLNELGFCLLDRVGMARLGESIRKRWVSSTISCRRRKTTSLCSSSLRERFTCVVVVVAVWVAV